MQNNIKPAVLIIAVLSLLLGLSIGQHARQYRQIKSLEHKLAAPTVIIQSECRLGKPKALFIQTKAGIIKQEIWEAQRAEIEAIKETMRAEREAQLKELRQEVEHVRQMWQRGK